MFAFQKACDTFEKLSAVERRQLLEEKSQAVFHALQRRSVSESEAKEILAGFMIGSVMIDGTFSELEYLLIYPCLVKTFGHDFNFREIKERFRHSGDGGQTVAEYTRKMLRILRASDETLRQDILVLCMCATSIDGKITLREKRYIRYLWEA